MSARDTERIAPLGRYHSSDVCWRCGAAGHLIRIVVRATHAEALACADRIACERRYHDGRRQLGLFDMR